MPNPALTVLLGGLPHGINITMMSEWARWCLKSPASRLFTQAFIRAQIKVNIKAPRHWPLSGEFTGDRFPMASNAENISILMTSPWTWLRARNEGLTLTVNDWWMGWDVLVYINAEKNIRISLLQNHRLWCGWITEFSMRGITGWCWMESFQN